MGVHDLYFRKLFNTQRNHVLVFFWNSVTTLQESYAYFGETLLSVTTTDVYSLYGSLLSDVDWTHQVFTMRDEDKIVTYTQRSYEINRWCDQMTIVASEKTCFRIFDQLLFIALYGA